MSHTEIEIKTWEASRKSHHACGKPKLLLMLNSFCVFIETYHQFLVGEFCAWSGSDFGETAHSRHIVCQRFVYQRLRRGHPRGGLTAKSRIGWKNALRN